MRLIDADNTLKSIDKAIQKYDENDDILEFISELRYSVIGQPTADAQEVRHGKWIEQSRGFYSCSCCGRTEHLNGLMVTEKNENQLLHLMYPYCHCGAKMDLGD